MLAKLGPVGGTTTADIAVQPGLYAAMSSLISAMISFSRFFMGQNFISKAISIFGNVKSGWYAFEENGSCSF